MPRFRLAYLLLALAILPLASCFEPEPELTLQDPYAGLTPDTIVFKDEVVSMEAPSTNLSELEFVDREGKAIDLKQYLGKSNIVLVVMRGFPGFVCPYCTAQTSRLIRSFEEFEKRNAQILVVYPGPTEHVPDFVQSSQTYADGKSPPFPILLDQGFDVVKRLGITGDLAKPSTYIMDTEGRVRFAYVGASTSDRPSLAAMLAQLDKINTPK